MLNTLVLKWPLLLFAVCLLPGIWRGHERYGEGLVTQPVRLVFYAGLAAAMTELTARQGLRLVTVGLYAIAFWQSILAVVPHRHRDLADPDQHPLHRRDPRALADDGDVPRDSARHGDREHRPRDEHAPEARARVLRCDCRGGNRAGLRAHDLPRACRRLRLPRLDAPEYAKDGSGQVALVGAGTGSARGGDRRASPDDRDPDVRSGEGQPAHGPQRSVASGRYSRRARRDEERPVGHPKRPAHCRRDRQPSDQRELRVRNHRLARPGWRHFHGPDRRARLRRSLARVAYDRRDL